ncbi:MAG: hypothetical protein LUC20_08180 [Oscillospiraceae bacterium]|nr:hypothetical protein [Oscillospiraceae bacterium]
MGRRKELPLVKKQEIRVKTVYDGEQTDKQAFVKLMIEKYRLDNSKIIIDISQDTAYNSSRLNQSGLCG